MNPNEKELDFIQSSIQTKCCYRSEQLRTVQSANPGMNVNKISFPRVELFKTPSIWEVVGTLYGGACEEVEISFQEDSETSVAEEDKTLSAEEEISSVLKCYASKCWRP